MTLYLSSRPQQQFKSLDFDAAAKLRSDDGFIEPEELAQAFKNELYLYEASDSKLVDSEEHRVLFFSKGKAGNLNVPDANIRLTSNAVKYVEENLLNGYRFPEILRRDWYKSWKNEPLVERPFARNTMALSDMVDHLMGVIDTDKDGEISPAEWDRFKNETVKN